MNGAALELESPLEAVIWAMTSANHANTRRNPLPAHRRRSRDRGVCGRAGAPVVRLPDRRLAASTPRFADYVLKKIEVDSRGRFRLTPAKHRRGLLDAGSHRDVRAARVSRAAGRVGGPQSATLCTRNALAAADTAGARGAGGRPTGRPTRVFVTEGVPGHAAAVPEVRFGGSDRRTAPQPLC